MILYEIKIYHKWYHNVLNILLKIIHLTKLRFILPDDVEELETSESTFVRVVRVIDRFPFLARSTLYLNWKFKIENSKIKNPKIQK